MGYIIATLFFSFFFFIAVLQTTDDVKVETFLTGLAKSYQEEEIKLENGGISKLFSRYHPIEKKVKKNEPSNKKKPRRIQKVNLRPLFEKNVLFKQFIIEWIDFTYEKLFKEKVGKLFVESLLKHYQLLSEEEKKSFELIDIIKSKKQVPCRDLIFSIYKGSKISKIPGFLSVFEINELPAIYFYYCPRSIEVFLYTQEQLTRVNQEIKRHAQEKNNRWGLNEFYKHLHPDRLLQNWSTFFSFELKKIRMKNDFVESKKFILKRVVE
jgi:hypothetical protein